MRNIKDTILGFLMFMIYCLGPFIFFYFVFSKSLFLGILLIFIIAGLFIYYDLFKGGRGGIGPDMDNPAS